MQNEISVSFIIAARENDSTYLNAVKAIKQLNFDADQIEVLVSRGKNPSLQRNRAANLAKGEYLYFLDDDSLIDSDTLNQIKKFLAEYSPDVVGGPSLLESRATPFQQSLYQILASPLTVGPLFKRFAAAGSVPQKSNEQEVILANLIIKKEFYLKFGGLDKDIYPGEENNFLIKHGRKNSAIFYHPAMIVRRNTRNTLKAFIEQIYSYGVGRANHISLFGITKYWPFLTSLFFSLYLTSLLFIQNFRYTIPLLGYGIYLILVVSYFTFRQKKMAVREFFLIPLMHYLYGVGVLSGLLFKNVNARVSQSSAIQIHYEYKNS